MNATDCAVFDSGAALYVGGAVGSYSVAYFLAERCFCAFSIVHNECQAYPTIEYANFYDNTPYSAILMGYKIIITHCVFVTPKEGQKAICTIRDLKKHTFDYCYFSEAGPLETEGELSANCRTGTLTASHEIVAANTGDCPAVQLAAPTPPLTQGASPSLSPALDTPTCRIAATGVIRDGSSPFIRSLPVSASAIYQRSLIFRWSILVVTSVIADSSVWKAGSLPIGHSVGASASAKNQQSVDFSWSRTGVTVTIPNSGIFKGRSPPLGRSVAVSDVLPPGLSDSIQHAPATISRQSSSGSSDARGESATIVVIGVVLGLILVIVALFLVFVLFLRRRGSTSSTASVIEDTSRIQTIDSTFSLDSEPISMGVSDDMELIDSGFGE
jgi:hypothetical protein